MKCVFVACAVLAYVIAVASGNEERAHIQSIGGCIKTAKSNALCKLTCSKQCKDYFDIIDAATSNRRNVARSLCTEHTVGLKECIHYKICLCSNCIFTKQLCENSVNQACRDAYNNDKHADCGEILTE